MFFKMYGGQGPVLQVSNEARKLRSGDPAVGEDSG